jgi:OFA family oxalate/formate antiporter-like MFS transporter
MIATVLFCAGLAVAGWGVTKGSLYSFYLGYGVIGGIGLGVGYLAPVSTLVSWFPDRRGFATGMAVLGFGMGAFAAGPIAAKLIESIGIANRPTGRVLPFLKEERNV